MSLDHVAHVRDSYATATALDVYRKRADSGLRIWETTVVERHFPPAARVLTVGCGAGRETFALEQRGHHATGVDISPPLRALTLAAHARASAARASGARGSGDGGYSDAPSELRLGAAREHELGS